jgi:hypothetical protein
VHVRPFDSGRGRQRSNALTGVLRDLARVLQWKRERERGREGERGREAEISSKGGPDHEFHKDPVRFDEGGGEPTACSRGPW